MKNIPLFSFEPCNHHYWCWYGSHPERHIREPLKKQTQSSIIIMLVGNQHMPKGRKTPLQSRNKFKAATTTTTPNTIDRMDRNFQSLLLHQQNQRRRDDKENDNASVKQKKKQQQQQKQHQLLTPHSLLKTEIQQDHQNNACTEEADKSLLLLSPSPAVVPTSSTSAPATTLTYRKMSSSRKLAKLAKQPSKNIPPPQRIHATLRESTEQVVFLSPKETTASKHRVKFADDDRSNKKISKESELQTATTEHPTVIVAIQNTPKQQSVVPFENDSTVVLHQQHNQLQSPSINDPNVQREITQLLNNMQPQSQQPQPPQERMAITASTPRTIAKKGVCMDLSHFFADQVAADKQQQQPSNPQSIHHQSRYNNMQRNSNEWADKQVQTFTNWLNHLFYPNRLEHFDSENDQHGDEHHTNAAAAFRTLVLHQRLAQARLKALDIWKTEEFSGIRQKLKNEIAQSKISLRDDQSIYANLTSRQKVLSLLFSYSTPWLRLGLETVFAAPIRPDLPTQFSPQCTKKSSSSASAAHLKNSLRQFILQKVISDETVLAKYTHGKCKVPSGKFGEKYRSELNEVVLYRLLVLFIFLDRARMQQAIDRAPMLFTKNAACKSTREVLLSFCRDFLRSQGDFVKHLSRKGIHVFYKQDPVAELDFTVHNLKVDLNDGVRLVRMAEIVSERADLLHHLRIPAVSRLQKFHNVGLALNRLKEVDILQSMTTVAPHHVVDGHREMVLKLLWHVAAHMSIDLVSVSQVRDEILRIRRLRCHQNHISQHWYSENHDVDDLESALLQWCDVICSGYGSRRVTDWTTSFADGKVVCLLMHFYHPTLLPFARIRPTTCEVSLRPSDTDRPLLLNERANCILANKCMSELGGIPQMIPLCDTSSPPEAKSMQLCLTILCSRLMESSLEVRASVMIQNFYRRHFQRVWRKRKESAASQIWLAWKSNRERYYCNRISRYGAAVALIENFVAERKSALHVLRLQRLAFEESRLAATTIQVSHLKYSNFVDRHSLSQRRSHLLSLELCRNALVPCLPKAI
jgi:abnormal spindle-like microcephaly-associated protein